MPHWFCVTVTHWQEGFVHFSGNWLQARRQKWDKASDVMSLTKLVTFWDWLHVVDWKEWRQPKWADEDRQATGFTVSWSISHYFRCSTKSKAVLRLRQSHMLKMQLIGHVTWIVNFSCIEVWVRCLFEEVRWVTKREAEASVSRHPAFQIPTDSLHDVPVCQQKINTLKIYTICSVTGSPWHLLNQIAQRLGSYILSHFLSSHLEQVL